MIVEAIKEYLLEGLKGRGVLRVAFAPAMAGLEGAVVISWTEPTDQRFKMKSLHYQIFLHDGYATLVCGGWMICLLDYADPAFPDNLIDRLPVLPLPSSGGSPHQATPIGE